MVYTCHTSIARILKSMKYKWTGYVAQMDQL